MHIEKKITVKSFKLIKNPNAKGSYCAFNQHHYINYQDKCYYHPQLKIFLCQSCGQINKSKLKFNNKPTGYDGYIYDSKLESKFAEQLDWKLKTGQIKDWKRQVKIEINVKFIDDKPILTLETMQDLIKQGLKAKHLTNYFMDFVVTNNDNSITFIETKGLPTSLWKLKWRLTEIITDGKVNLEIVREQKIKKGKN